MPSDCFLISVGGACVSITELTLEPYLDNLVHKMLISLMKFIGLKWINCVDVSCYE